MEIRGLVVDPVSNVPIVILRDASGDRFLPIWIGAFEANAIAIRLEGASTPRPLTHDLLLAVLQRLGGRVEKVVVTDLRSNTFYAEVFLEQGGEVLVLDARPSDAIALALRAGAAIFVERHVLELAQSAVPDSGELSEEERLRRWLEALGPEDLGKYEM